MSSLPRSRLLKYCILISVVIVCFLAFERHYGLQYHDQIVTRATSLSKKLRTLTNNAISIKESVFNERISENKSVSREPGRELFSVTEVRNLNKTDTTNHTTTVKQAKETSSDHNLTTKESEDRFTIDPSFHLPWHGSKSVESIQSHQWFEDLKQFLAGSVPNSPIVTVSTDGSFQDSLFNWLASAILRGESRVRNILVVTYDSNLCKLINFRQVAKCIAVPAENVTSQGVYTHKKRTNFYKLLIIRVVVLRLLNHWGYDVANFDTDAILLRNPVPLFYSPEYLDSDIVGTYGGALPGSLLNKWGVVVCMGAILIRSTPHTEALWQSMNTIKLRDDQLKLNYGLDKLNVHWTTEVLATKDTNDTRLSTRWTGKTEKGDLKITLLPQNIACRGRPCSQLSAKSVYIWHHGKTGHSFRKVVKQAFRDGVWFLKSNWKKVSSFTDGMDWLRQISTVT